jgi:hypothetical protein
MFIDIERKYTLLKACYLPTTSTTFFAAATKSANETNKAGSTCILITLSFLDVYDCAECCK